MSIQGVYEWFTAEVQWALMIGLLVLLIVTAFKRAWIAMIGVLIGMAFIGMFIINPNLILDLAEWFTGMFGL